MVSAMMVGAVSQASLVTSRAAGQGVPGRATRRLPSASRQSDDGSQSQNPIFSAAVAVTLAGGLMLADVGAVQAAQGDVYEKLGIAPPTGGSGVIVAAPERKTPFQSRGSPAVKKAPEPAAVISTPAPTPVPAPKSQVSKPQSKTADKPKPADKLKLAAKSEPSAKPKPASKPKPAAKPLPDPAKKLAVKKAAEKKSVKNVAPVEAKTSQPLKLSKDSIKQTTRGSLPSGLEAPEPSSGGGKVSLVQPKLKKSFQSSGKTSKAAAAAAAAGAAGAGAAATGFSLPKFELPSFTAPSISAPSISAPSVSLPSGGNGLQQALVVAGVEAVLAVIVSSIVGGLFSKKTTKKVSKA